MYQNNYNLHTRPPSWFCNFSFSRLKHWVRVEAGPHMSCYVILLDLPNPLRAWIRGSKRGNRDVWNNFKDGFLFKRPKRFKAEWCHKPYIWPKNQQFSLGKGSRTVTAEFERQVFHSHGWSLSPGSWRVRPFGFNGNFGSDRRRRSYSGNNALQAAANAVLREFSHQDRPMPRPTLQANFAAEFNGTVYARMGWGWHGGQSCRLCCRNWWAWARHPNVITAGRRFPHVSMSYTWGAAKSLFWICGVQFGIGAHSSARNGSLKRQRCSALVSFSWTCSLLDMAAANFASRSESGRAAVPTTRAGHLWIWDCNADFQRGCVNGS